MQGMLDFDGNLARHSIDRASKDSKNGLGSKEGSHHAHVRPAGLKVGSWVGGTRQAKGESLLSASPCWVHP